MKSTPTPHVATGVTQEELQLTMAPPAAASSMM